MNIYFTNIEHFLLSRYGVQSPSKNSSKLKYIYFRHKNTLYKEKNYFVKSHTKDNAPFACLKNGLFGFFFQPEQCFSLTTIQPEQCFSTSFSQVSDQRTGPIIEISLIQCERNKIHYKTSHIYTTLASQQKT